MGVKVQFACALAHFLLVWPILSEGNRFPDVGKIPQAGGV